MAKLPRKPRRRLERSQRDSENDSTVKENAAYLPSSERTQAAWILFGVLRLILTSCFFPARVCIMRSLAELLPDRVGSLTGLNSSFVRHLPSLSCRRICVSMSLFC
jgi:hypothetical protein